MRDAAINLRARPELDAPPARNPGLERLMAVKPPWVRKPARTLAVRKSAKG
jgi:hypothetical protein